MGSHKQSRRIRDFILDHVEEHPSEIGRLTAGRFKISRSAVTRHLRQMVDAGELEAAGTARGRRYSLGPAHELAIELKVTNLQEHVPWEQHVRPRLEGLPQNVLQICSYGFLEMLNNAIDHSGSPTILIGVTRTPSAIELAVSDEGIGIFRKIKEAFHLAEEREAILELVKGKLTTDPARHTGEGIFFTSRVFDLFTILSGESFYAHERSRDDWMIETGEAPLNGTYVTMRISTAAKTQLREVFEQFSSGPHEFAFARTHVPLKLASYGGESLVSRSQARRVLGRFDKFEEVLLDFADVDSIGQAFADEIFRVFRRERPDVRIKAIRANDHVQAMINRALSHGE